MVVGIDDYDHNKRHCNKCFTVHICQSKESWFAAASLMADETYFRVVVEIDQNISISNQLISKTINSVVSPELTYMLFTFAVNPQTSFEGEMGFCACI